LIADDQFIRIAVISGAHSLYGRLKILVVSDNLDRFEPGKYIFLKVKGGYKRYKILEFIQQKGKICLLGLEGVSDREASMSLKGIEIFITKEEAEKTRDKLEENSFYYYDLIGCHVYLDGKKFAEVKNIIEAGSGEILIITTDEGKEIMIPFVEAMVNTDMITEKRIDIFPVEGLLDI